MAYRHGVGVSEVPTSLVPPTESSAGLPVVFGTAPINLTQREKAPVNEPVLCYTYAEAVQALGYSDDFDSYTLCEFMSSHFSLFTQAPVVFVNVLDPEKHKKKGELTTLTVVNNEATLEKTGVILSSLVVKSGNVTYEKDVEYTTEFDDNGYLNIFMHVEPSVTTIQVEFDQLDPTSVTPNDIIGGVDVNGNYTGLELIDKVFPKFRLVPGQIVVPKFSADSAVAAVMAAKASNINGLFKAIALVDISTEEVKNYTEVAEHKNNNNLTSTFQTVLWPKVALGGKQYHLSTQAAGVICRTDAENEDVPYVSPSNKNLQADSAVLADGTEITLGHDQAAYLNGEGIVTALNFIGGWKLWGNRTGAYPAVTDPKDSFIPVRRMMNWVSNTLILTYWQKVDDPTKARLIETVVDSVNIWLNGLSTRGFLLGGRVEFRPDENPLTDLIDGIVRFHVYITPPTPARQIDFIVEFDVEYFNTLFAA